MDSQNEETLRQQASLLAMMANPTRLAIMRLLLEEEWCVQDLAMKVGLSENATSMHLAKLRRGRMVTTNRRSQNIFYAARSIKAVVILNALDALSGSF